MPKIAENITIDYIEGLNYRTLQKIGRSLHLNAKLPRDELIIEIKKYCKSPQDFATPMTLETLTLFDIRYIAKTFNISPSTKKHEIIRILREEKKVSLTEDDIKEILSQIKRKGKRTGRDELPMIQQAQQLEEHGYSHGKRESTLPIVKAFEAMIQSIQKSEKKHVLKVEDSHFNGSNPLVNVNGSNNIHIPSNLPQIMYTAEEADHFLAFLQDQKLSDFHEMEELDDDLLRIYRRIVEDALHLLQSPPQHSSSSSSQSTASSALPPVIHVNRPRMKSYMYPINLVGDIGGHFDNLMYVLSEAIGGFPSNKNAFVFLGNIISPPLQSNTQAPHYFHDGNMTSSSIRYGNHEIDSLNALRCIFALLFLKLANPSSMHILRSNETLIYLQQENQRIQETEQYSEDYKMLWRRLLEVYQHFPVAAVLEKSVFLCPGGVGPLTATMSIDDMNKPRQDASTTATCWMKELILAGKQTRLTSFCFVI